MISATMTSATTTEPLLLELDEQTWEQYLDRSESWFGNILTTQAKFRALAEAAVDKIHEPHVKQYLREIADKAREHEHKAEELYRLIGREPANARRLLGSILSKGSEWTADLIGWMGGASSPWGDLRQLLLANLDALGAFAVAEQLGYALGLPELAETCFDIVREKHTHQLLIQEYMLEIGPAAILYPASAARHSAPGLTDKATETRMFQRQSGQDGDSEPAAGSSLRAAATANPALAITLAIGAGFVAAALWGLRRDRRHADA